MQSSESVTSTSDHSSDNEVSIKKKKKKSCSLSLNLPFCTKFVCFIGSLSLCLPISVMFQKFLESFFTCNLEGKLDNSFCSHSKGQDNGLKFFLFLKMNCVVR